MSREIKVKSGRRESPVISEGDGKDGRSTYNRQCCREESEFAIESRTELWRQVYLPSSRYDLQLETRAEALQDGDKTSRNINQKETTYRDSCELAKCCLDT